MTFDSGALSTALAADPNGVAALFGVYATTTDSQISYINSTNNTKAGNYAVTVTQLATQGILKGSTPTTTDLSADATPTLAVNIDGFQSANISLDQKNYASYADMAADLQSKINGDSTLKGAGVTAVVNYDTTANRFVISSQRYGSASKVQISSIDATLAGQLGLAQGAQATIFGGSLQSTTIDATNNTLSLSVDGGASATLTLTQGSYTGATLATEVQNQINAAGLNAIATYNTAANRLELASATISASSAIQITGVGSSTASTLGLAISNGIQTGQDVAGSIGNNGATGSGQYLTGLGDASGLNIAVNGGASSPIGASRGTIAFNKGFAYQLNQLFTSALSDTGILSADTQGIQSQIDSLQAQQTRFEERMTQIQAMYTQQFTTLDTTIAQLRQTSSALTQQLASLPKVG
jgi:flagellar hook-associated protein 2